MATATEVIHELVGHTTDLAKALDDVPSGVTPGFNAYVGATFNPNGTVRYVRPAGAVLTIDAIYTMSTTNTVLGDGTAKRLNFNTQVYDPLSQVTTGSSWAFTAAAAGTYIVLVSAPLNIDGGVDWVAADRADLSIQGSVSRVLATWVGIGVLAKPSDLTLDGFRGVSLSAGGTFYAQIVQDCGTNRTVDTAIANIIIAHV